MRKKKRDSLRKRMESSTEEHVILTNCPSCVSGLGRNVDMGVKPRHIAEMLALSLGGENWENELRGLVSTSERVTF